MNYRENTIEELLKKHKFNIARTDFLENQIKRLSPEKHEDYIAYKMYRPGYSGAAPRFILERGEEIAQLNSVEETACEYREKCVSEFTRAWGETEKELKELRVSIAVIEDGLNTLERMNGKYRAVVEKYYVYNLRMEDIADMIHTSRSRCYELRKEGVKLMAQLIFGETGEKQGVKNRTA